MVQQDINLMNQVFGQPNQSRINEMQSLKPQHNQQEEAQIAWITKQNQHYGMAAGVLKSASIPRDSGNILDQGYMLNVEN